MSMKRRKRRAAPTVRLRPNNYQPTKAEVEEDAAIDARPQAVARAIVAPVRILPRKT